MESIKRVRTPKDRITTPKVVITTGGNSMYGLASPEVVITLNDGVGTAKKMLMCGAIEEIVSTKSHFLLIG